MPNLTNEIALGSYRVCGVDEAGRGPWAGPVVAASVMFCPSAMAEFAANHDAHHLTPTPLAGEEVVHVALCTCNNTHCASIPHGLNDSKKLSRTAREKLLEQLLAANICHGIGIASAQEIDGLNIWGATQLAMRRAVAAMPMTPEFALIDGKVNPKDFPCPTRAIVGGDGISLSIAAASIFAKVTRDRMMDDYAKHYPQYGFERHAGYGTKFHQEALAVQGICPIHRISYAPIRALMTKVAA